jgi:hypothetical protein
VVAGFGLADAVMNYGLRINTTPFGASPVLAWIIALTANKTPF